MQVAQVNSSVASTLGQTQAEETPARADDFARVLRTAVYGRGSEAVAKTTERAMSAAAPRTETRPVERPSRDRAETAPRDSAASQPSRDDASSAPSRTETAPRKTEDTRSPAKTDAQAPAKDTATEKPAAKDGKTADEAAPQQDAAKPVDQQAEAPAKDGTAEETAEEVLPDDAKPVVAEAPDAALILALLQTQTQAVPAATPAAAAVPAATAVAAPAAAAVAAAAPVVPVVPAAPTAEDAAAAALAAAAAEAAKGQTATPATAEAAAKAATITAETAAVPAAPVAGAADPLIKTATDTSAAALLSQQQTVTAEDFAAIQQALTAQAQSQGEVAAQVQAQAGKPVTAETKPKIEPKAEKIVAVDVQTAAAPKTLVDQAALLAMQDDDQAAADAALLQQQAQAALHQQAQQPAAGEIKFNTALLQASGDATLPGSPAASSNSQSAASPAAAIGSTAAPATQATQHAAAQTPPRHLSAYIPAGEQVAVQIKKGVAEGVDKISIKLDPGNLGKVEIKLEVGHDGRLTAVIAADKPETLQLLQQDVKNLEQSLRDAGLKTDQQSLNFTLRDQGQSGEGRDGHGAGNGRQRGQGDDYAETGMRTDPAQLAAANAQRAAAARGGLDIRI